MQTLQSNIMGFVAAILCLLLTLPLQAQFNTQGISFRQIADTVKHYADASGDSTEGGVMTRTSAFEAFWSPRASANDSPGINMFGLYYKTLNQAVLARYGGTCAGNGQFQGSWKCIGPDKLDKQAMGYVECIWADPAEDWTTSSGSRTLLAGTYGGLFKTTDGGAHWKCITDNAPIANGVNVVSSIAVKPGDNNTIFLGMGNSQIAYWENYQAFGTTGLYGASILKTTDGGQSWQQELLNTATIGGNEFDRVQKIYFTPSGSYVIAFRNERIFIRSVNNALWEEITTSLNNPLAGFGDAAQWRDLEFVPGDISADHQYL